MKNTFNNFISKTGLSTLTYSAVWKNKILLADCPFICNPLLKISTAFPGTEDYNFYLCKKSNVDPIADRSHAYFISEFTSILLKPTVQFHVAVLLPAPEEDQSLLLQYLSLERLYKNGFEKVDTLTNHDLFTHIHTYALSEHKEEKKQGRKKSVSARQEEQALSVCCNTSCKNPGTVARLACLKCKKAVYCNTHCKKAHRQKHKKQCVPQAILKKHCHNALCKKEAEKLLRCSHCKKTYYCSTGCQKLDWNAHKLTCKEEKKEKLAAATT